MHVISFSPDELIVEEMRWWRAFFNKTGETWELRYCNICQNESCVDTCVKNKGCGLGYACRMPMDQMAIPWS